MCNFWSILAVTLTQIHPFTFIYSKWIGLDHLKSAVRPPLQITPNAQPLKCRECTGRPRGGAGLMLVIKWLQVGRIAALKIQCIKQMLREYLCFICYIYFKMCF